MCEQIKRCLALFYKFTLQVSKDEPCLIESLGIMWGLDDLLNDVKKRDGKFADISDNILAAFNAIVVKLQTYYDLYRENIMYYVCYILDPRQKLVNIKQQMPNQANDIINEIREWLKKEYPAKRTTARQDLQDIPCPVGISDIQWKLLKRALPVTPAEQVSDIDRYLDLPIIQ
jgi:hypothetical protein